MGRIWQMKSDNLSSDAGVNYTRLRDLLAAEKWREADDETYSVMRQVLDLEEDDTIAAIHLLNFPCTDLRTIDSLWGKYSSGRFGFSVQKKIYLDVGGKPDGKCDPETWEKFADAIGWRVNKTWLSTIEKTFDTKDPPGHLPFPLYHLPWASCIASRLINCNIIQ